MDIVYRFVLQVEIKLFFDDEPASAQRDPTGRRGGAFQQACSSGTSEFSCALGLYFSEKTAILQAFCDVASSLAH